MKIIRDIHSNSGDLFDVNTDFAWNNLKMFIKLFNFRT